MTSCFSRTILTTSAFCKGLTRQQMTDEHLAQNLKNRSTWIGDKACSRASPSITSALLLIFTCSCFAKSSSSVEISACLPRITKSFCSGFSKCVLNPMDIAVSTLSPVKIQTKIPASWNNLIACGTYS
eukprot:NODE_101_length_19951_cov_0.932501.p18 type:complete len:128 gc:universal NODE_101_length_19951_cov_0.932501:1899-2282(+)